MKQITAGRSSTRVHPSGSWPPYGMVWRWHFYAGLFCIPFVVFLSISGAIYVFKPQIEVWIDRAYDNLIFDGKSAAVAAQVSAALAAVPGATFSAYEIPQSANAAARVIVARNGEQTRVYIHPRTLHVLKLVGEEDRFMQVIFWLHGTLLLGNWGSAIVELAASWAIIMILTGLYLWWPRQRKGLAGVLYPRLGHASAILWRDLHAVTGIWISAFALFILLTGLPWSKVWGDYFEQVRHLTGTNVAQQDWAVGKPAVENKVVTTPLAGHHTHRGSVQAGAGDLPDVAAIDKVVQTARQANLAPPVMIAPPTDGSVGWTAKSDAQNRMLRADLVIDGSTGEILVRENFADRHPLDQIVGIGIAAHEGQLFGWPNQLLNVVVATGLVLMSVSAVVLWLRRRKPGALGAPQFTRAGKRFLLGLGVIVVLLCIYLPLFAVSLLAVKLTEQFVLRRIPSVCDWLGLSTRT